MNRERLFRLRLFMLEYDITFRAIGEQIDVVAQRTRTLLTSETIPTKYYTQLIALGFPPDTLPEPMDPPPGSRIKVPRFPGLTGMQSTA